MKKITNILFLTVCALVILVPVFFFNLKPNQISEAENRQLAELRSPKEGISTFMKSVDSYVNDRIGFRDQAVRLYRQITIQYLNYRHDQVLIGDDGWLFYHDDLPDYTGTNYSSDTVEQYIAILKQIDTWCKQRNIQFIFAVGPNKSTIYSEYMPGYVKQAEVTLLDALLERAEQESLPVICPKQALLENKDNQELYMRLDTHWNALGARYMLDQITDKLSMPRYDGPVSTEQILEGDLKGMLGIDKLGVASVATAVPAAEGSRFESIANTQHQLLHSENTEPFICYRDSFTLALENYYTHYFNGPMYWSFVIDFNHVNSARPKYLILECVERYLPDALNQNAHVLTWDQK